jgi:HPt (histidine-containing phosphotransfer) domain-containing protein
MDTSSPIDIDLAIQGLGGEPQIFYMMLGNLEGMTLNPTMKNIIEPFEKRQYKEMKDLAHSLKGASGYIGASRLHYVCYFIQEHFVFERYEKMLEYYPSLVEAAIEFKIHSRKIIAKFKGKSIL